VPLRQHPDHSGATYCGGDLETEWREALGDLACHADFMERQLRVRMQIPVEILQIRP
jgi:hypothetical protein